MHKNRMRCTVALAALAFSGLALSAPSNPIVNESSVQFSQWCSADLVCIDFYADVWETTDGSRTGYVSVIYQDPYNQAFLTVWCTGPQSSAAVSVKPGDGQSSVIATLDPSAPGCQGWSVGSAPSVLTLDLHGTFDGLVRRTLTGVETTYSSDPSIPTTKANYQQDCFSETLTGTATPYIGTSVEFAYVCTKHEGAR